MMRGGGEEWIAVRSRVGRVGSMQWLLLLLLLRLRRGRGRIATVRLRRGRLVGWVMYHGPVWRALERRRRGLAVHCAEAGVGASRRQRVSCRDRVKVVTV